MTTNFYVSRSIFFKNTILVRSPLTILVRSGPHHIGEVINYSILTTHINLNNINIGDF